MQFEKCIAKDVKVSTGVVVAGEKKERERNKR